MVFFPKLPKPFYFFIVLQSLPFFLTSFAWLSTPRDLLSWRKDQGCCLLAARKWLSPSIKGQHRATASAMGRGPLARKRDRAFLQGHVTTKNLPEPSKSKYSRNGFAVDCTVPTRSEGNFKEPAQILPVYIKTINLILCFFISASRPMSKWEQNWAVRRTANGINWDLTNYWIKLNI